MLEQFLASRRDLSAADRDMVRGWRDPVEGVFEIPGKDRTAIVLLNLLDDLEYRTYSNMGPAAFRRLPKGGFLYARLVPISPVPGAWLVSGYMTSFPKSGAAQIAQVALQLATTQPELVFATRRRSSRAGSRCGRTGPRSSSSSAATSWSCRRPKRRNGSTPTTGTVRQAVLAAHPERRKPRHVPDTDVPTVDFPAELADADTIGLIYDEIDGLNFYNDYGMLRELFADPALAVDKRYSDVLRGYLESDTVGPLPIRRLAIAHPETADAVFRKVLRKPGFTWADHGEALLRRRKAWYYEHEPRPGISVIGARLQELIALR